MRRRAYLGLAAVTAVSIAGCSGSDGAPQENDNENGPLSVVETYWDRFEAGNESGFRELFHPDSPERDRDEWGDEEFWEEEFPPAEGVEWTSEKRELLVETNEDAVVREEYRWTDVDGATWEIVDRFELRSRDDEWKIWEIQQEQSEQVD
jgi:hypothetical protein